VGGFTYNPDIKFFEKDGKRYNIWQATKELENYPELGLGYNDLYAL